MSKKEDTTNSLVIYQAYPKHVGRAAALNSIGRALKKIASADLLAATQGYAKSVEHLRGTDEWYKVPHPATWYNQERWTDDPEDRPTSQSSGRVGRVKAKRGKYDRPADRGPAEHEQDSAG